MRPKWSAGYSTVHKHGSNQKRVLLFTFKNAYRRQNKRETKWLITLNAEYRFIVDASNYLANN